MTLPLAADAVLYAHDGKVTAQEFRAVLISSGLGSIRPIDDLGRLQRMIDQADLVVTARHPEDGRLLGIGRTLSDGCWCAYLSDLAVDADAKGLGIGRRLLAYIRERIGPEVALILASVPGAVSFYQTTDMEPLPDCFWSRRAR